MQFIDHSERPLTIAQLQKRIKGALGSEQFQNLCVTGQISGFKGARSGHWYFDLKDDDGNLLSCAMWANSTTSCRHLFAPSGYPSDGAQVIARGYLSFYEKNGRLSFVAQSLEPDGTGKLWMLFQQTRQKLQAEGLFDQSHKKPIPQYPKKIVLLTSETGEVRHDVCKVAMHRNPAIPICLVPIPVQGATAPEGIVRGLKIAQAVPHADVIILARGGGSMEDLWCFNDERVARAIYDSNIPVVTGIGHEPDFTIADDVADLRASTPSNAAELVVPDRTKLLHDLERLRRNMLANVEFRIRDVSERSLRVRARLTAQSPMLRMDQLKHQTQSLQVRLIHAMQENLDNRTMALAETDRRMQQGIDDVIQSQKVRWMHQQFRILHQDPGASIAQYQHQLDNLGTRLPQAQAHLLQLKRYQLEKCKARMEAISPKNVLERGYVIVTDGERVVSRKTEAAPNMQLHFADGVINVLQSSQGGVDGGEPDIRRTTQTDGGYRGRT